MLLHISVLYHNDVEIMWEKKKKKKLKKKLFKNI